MTEILSGGADRGGGDAHHAIPAIWLYPETSCDVEVELSFQGRGFMTDSIPSYNGKWMIAVDTSARYLRYKKQYGSPSEYTFLDYDGFREGPFQRNQGHCISVHDFRNWLSQDLSERGFLENEISDTDYYFGRLLRDKWRTTPNICVYPQEEDIINQSVSMRVVPRPHCVSRLWYWLRPVKEQISIPEPPKTRMKRRGVSVVELGFLSDANIPTILAKKAAGISVLAGFNTFETQ